MAVLRTYGRRSQAQPSSSERPMITKRTLDQSSTELPSGNLTLSTKRSRIESVSPIKTDKWIGNEEDPSIVEPIAHDKTYSSPQLVKRKTLFDYFSSPSASPIASEHGYQKKQTTSAPMSRSSPPPYASQGDSDSEVGISLTSDYASSSHNKPRRLFLRTSLRSAQGRRQLASSPPPNAHFDSADGGEPGKSRHLEQLMLSLPVSSARLGTTSKVPPRIGLATNSSTRAAQCPLCGMPLCRSSVEDTRIHRRYCNMIALGRRHTRGPDTGSSSLPSISDQPLSLDRATEAELCTHVSRSASNPASTTTPIVWTSCSSVFSFFSSSPPPESGMILCVSKSSSPTLRRFGTAAAEHAAREVGTVEDFIGLSSRYNDGGEDQGGQKNEPDLWDNGKSEKYKVYVYLRPSSVPKKASRGRGGGEKGGSNTVITGCIICEPAVKYSRVLIPATGSPSDGPSALVETMPPPSPSIVVGQDLSAAEGNDDCLVTASTSSLRCTPSSIGQQDGNPNNTALVGILLMYTHHLYRRQGIGHRLLDCASSTRFGNVDSTISQCRPSFVAFSQMTSSGWGLACSWLRAWAAKECGSAVPGPGPGSVPGGVVESVEARSEGEDGKLIYVNVYDSVFGQGGVDRTGAE